MAYSCISPGTEAATLSTSDGRIGLGLIRRALAHPEKVRQVLASVKTRGFRATKDLVQGKLAFGSVVGYSCAGTVAEVGEAVDGFQAGDRVAWAGSAYAHHAEIVVAPQNLVVRVPSGLDLRQAATVTLGAIALQGVRRAEPTLGETIGVIGLGILGQLTMQLLKAAGCRVVGLDLRRNRVDLARCLGLDDGLVPTEESPEIRIGHLTDGYGLDAVILTAASKSDEFVNLAMRLARRGVRIDVVPADRVVKTTRTWRRACDSSASGRLTPTRSPAPPSRGIALPGPETPETKDLLAGITIASIGPITAGTAARHGVSCHIVPDR